LWELVANMGACASCLGRRNKDYDEDEESRLLYDDANGGQYGSFGETAVNSDRDSTEARRESEALQRVVAKTSNNMVDIFEIAPNESSFKASSNAFAYSGQGARLARYQHLVSKLNTSEDDTAPAGVKVDWPAEEQQGQAIVRSTTSSTRRDDYGPLVGTFADAAAAMK